jgi:hypothetical protein
MRDRSILVETESIKNNKMEKDEDIKRVLRKGNIVEIVKESLAY